MVSGEGKEIPTGAKESSPLLDPALAREGVRNFKEIAQLLSPNLRHRSLKDNKIKACFIGTTPEIEDGDRKFFSTLSPEQSKETTSAFRTITNNFLLVSYPNDYQREKQIFSMINTAAATRILKEYQQFFPTEATQDPNRWFITNIHTWHQYRPIPNTSLDIFDIRFGLLSGIPLNAVLKYRPYRRARSKLDLKVLSQEEVVFFNAFHSDGKLPRTEENMQRLRDIVSKSGPQLSKEETELILQKRNVQHRAGHPGYFGFSPEDVEYGRKVEEFYEKSGIDQVETQLHQEAA